MASLSKDAGGKKRITFNALDGSDKRTTIRLGKMSVKVAESIRTKVEALVCAKDTATTIDRETSRWVASLSDAMHERLARAGLVERRAARADTLGELIDRFVAEADVKKATRDAYRQATDSLLDFFGAGAMVASLTPSDADRWRAGLVESGLAGATIAKRTMIAKSIFTRAARWGMIDASPFADLRSGSQINTENSVYVPREVIAKVLDACPDAHWRAVVALSRYAGLRCPSEHYLLRWGDVNWERSRMVVRSPKTARHDGHASRVVPIAPELRPILLDLFEEAREGDDRVLPRMTGGGANLRTTMLKIIARAGENPWPRLFQNLRASCASDWVERFPNHVVASWLGHSPMVAATHYLQTRDVHFDLAAGVEQGDTQSATRAAQNPPQHTEPQQCTTADKTPETAGVAGVMQGCATVGKPLHNVIMGATGLEPVTSAV